MTEIDRRLSEGGFSGQSILIPSERNTDDLPFIPQHKLFQEKDQLDPYKTTLSAPHPPSCKSHLDMNKMPEACCFALNTNLLQERW